MKQIIEVDVPIAEPLREWAKHATDDLPISMAPLVETMQALMASSGQAAVEPGARMRFEIHWPESVTEDARRTIAAQIQAEMLAHVRRSSARIFTAMFVFQAETVTAVMNSIRARHLTSHKQI